MSHKLSATSFFLSSSLFSESKIRCNLMLHVLEQMYLTFIFWEMTASEFDRFFEDALYDEFITSEHEGTVNRLILVLNKKMQFLVTSGWQTGWRTISASNIKIKEENQNSIKIWNRILELEKDKKMLIKKIEEIIEQHCFEWHLFKHLVHNQGKIN